MIRLLSGDCRDVLATLPADSVHCVVTSPPYYGLRDYQTGTWDGGDAACDHANGRHGATRRDGGRENIDGFNGSALDRVPPQQYRDTCGKCGAVRIDRQIGLEASPEAYLQTMVAVFREVRRVLRPDGTCWVNMGDSYANNGISGLHTKSATSTLGPNGDGLPGNQNWNVPTSGTKTVPHGLKPKDLLLMPARLALALQADGWWVRSDIIWHKPNPMPESCTDRPTSAHEHVFLLTKNARYYFDADAVREESEMTPQNRFTNGRGEKDAGYAAHRRPLGITEANGRNLRNVWTIATAVFSDWGETSRQVRVAWDAGVDGKKRKASPDCPVHGDQAVQAPNAGDRPSARIGGHSADMSSCCCEWYITKTEKTSHFATFPPALAERCIRAGTSERGCCAACGNPWCRTTERNLENVPTRMATKRAPVDGEALGAYLRQCRHTRGLLQKDVAAHFPSVTGGLTGCVANWELGLNTPMPEQWTKLKEVLSLDARFDEQIYGTIEVTITDYGPNKAAGVRTGTFAKNWNAETTTTGWQPGCQCQADYDCSGLGCGHQPCICIGLKPCIVLDPFAGAGTTLLVADRLQRDAIGIELNVAYTQMAMDRVRADAPLLVDAPVPEPPEDARMGDLFDMAAD